MELMERKLFCQRKRDRTWKELPKTQDQPTCAKELSKQKILKQKVSGKIDKSDSPLNLDIWILEPDYESPALICNPFKIWTKQFLLTI